MYIIYIYIYIYDPALPVRPAPPKGFGSRGPGVEMIPWSRGGDDFLWVGGGGYVTTGVCNICP